MEASFFVKIEYKKIAASLIEEAIKLTEERLVKEGFEVIREYGYENVHFDLFAVKGEEKRIYEFKMDNKSSYEHRREQYIRLQNAAKELNAKLLYIFVKPPAEGACVSIEDFEDILLDDLTLKKDVLFESLNSPTIQLVSNIKILLIDLKQEYIFVEGEALADIGTLTVSEEVFKRDPSISYINDNTFRFSFKIRMNHDFSIRTSEYLFEFEDIFESYH